MSYCEKLFKSSRDLKRHALTLVQSHKAVFAVNVQIVSMQQLASDLKHHQLVHSDLVSLKIHTIDL